MVSTYEMWLKIRLIMVNTDGDNLRHRGQQVSWSPVTRLEQYSWIPGRQEWSQVIVMKYL